MATEQRRVNVPVLTMTDQHSRSDMHICVPCQKSFETANALFAHRSRDHCNELLFDLGHDIVICVAKVNGRFRCPLVECKKEGSWYFGGTSSSI
ncbi:hypothetical protein BC941DRAFT_441522 [Chlamydoabsidia padenii]|nr:hypothetical protein BC941DRAFT_441522 [Chlamydoabsidia padenii]